MISKILEYSSILETEVVAVCKMGVYTPSLQKSMPGVSAEMLTGNVVN